MTAREVIEKAWDTHFDYFVTSPGMLDLYWKCIAPDLWSDYWREWRVFRSLCESGLILRGRL